MKKIVFIRRSHSKFISIIFYFFNRASISAAVLYHQFLSDRPTKRRRTHRDEDGTFSSHSVALVINLITRAHRVTILLQRAIVPPLIAPHPKKHSHSTSCELSPEGEYNLNVNWMNCRTGSWIESNWSLVRRRRKRERWDIHGLLCSINATRWCDSH